MNYFINSDITKAYTLPAKFYLDQEIYNQAIEKIFASSWQWIGDQKSIGTTAGSCHPFELLAESLSEPLVLVRDKNNELRCLSNVCTHRGKILVEEAGEYRMLSCKYHGRCFHLDGQFRSMPEFKEAQNFPSLEDNLPQLPLKGLGNLLFTSINPKYSFEETMQPIVERLSWFPFDQLSYDPGSSKTYIVDSHWALYCDNYLEGFHVPFVHPGLGANLSYQDYATEIYPHCNLQLGIASDNAAYFDLPKESPDYGKKIHAYYYWIFPNIMLNIYTWGVSINRVEPLGLE